MSAKPPGLKRKAKRLPLRIAISLLRVNLTGIGICLGVSVGFVAMAFWDTEPRIFARAVGSAAIVSMALSVPMFMYISNKLGQLWFVNRELEIVALQDSLTHVLNRGAFAACVDQKLKEMRDCAISRGALLVIDADHFKRINDRWGHNVGDRALVLMAAQLKAVARRDDAVGRLGGEEFGIFLNGSGSTSARSTAEKLRTLIEAIDLRNDESEPIRLSVSIGAVHFTEVLSFDKLYRLADQKLYEAKEDGRNRVAFEELRVGQHADLAA